MSFKLIYRGGGENHRILHDLLCASCDVIEKGVLVQPDRYPQCPKCGGPRTWVPAGFSTDVYGSPQYSDASGLWHSSQREKEKHMAKHGYEVAGDKVHGARSELKIHHTGFSYPGQQSRISTGER